MKKQQLERIEKLANENKLKKQKQGLERLEKLEAFLEGLQESQFSYKVYWLNNKQEDIYHVANQNERPAVACAIGWARFVLPAKYRFHLEIDWQVYGQEAFHLSLPDYNFLFIKPQHREDFANTPSWAAKHIREFIQSKM